MQMDGYLEAKKYHDARRAEKVAREANAHPIPPHGAPEPEGEEDTTVADEELECRRLVNEIDTEARTEADVSIDFSEASPFPTVEDIQKDVYWEADNPSERKSQGRLFFD